VSITEIKLFFIGENICKIVVEYEFCINV